MQALTTFFAGLWASIKPYMGEIGAVIATALYKDKQDEAEQQKQRADALQSRLDVEQKVDAMPDADVHKQLYSDFGPRGVQRLADDKPKRK